MRYGRLSKNSDSYTMVFANLQPRRFGQAKAVPCRNTVSTIGDLTTEAEWLWAAEVKKVMCRKDEEDRKVEPSHAVSANWGYAALLVNPDSEKDSTKGTGPVEDLRRQWADHVSRTHMSRCDSLKSCLVENGMLRIRLASDSRQQKGR